MAKSVFSIRWTSPALQDLLAAADFIKADNAEAARRFGDEIKRKCLRLEQFPLSGREVPEFSGSGLREIIAGEYRVIYKIDSSHRRIEILTVRHGTRLFPG